ncbi:MAG: glycosyltransferase family 39 protein [Candidatus Magasanikbacteria bacterium]|nr:glycosyltransferase family 39 protein [Candidatus Magasanikbacteria bacterium]
MRLPTIIWQAVTFSFKHHRQMFFLTAGAALFFFLYLYLYLNPSVLELTPYQFISCSSVFNNTEKQEVFSSLADVEIKCGAAEPIKLEHGPIPAYLILNQPDETINYFFIRQFAFFNKFFAEEKLNSFALNQVHPRSATVVNGQIVPIGFPGFIIIYGLAIKFLSFVFSWNLFNVFAVSLTPWLAAITPFFLYGFLRRVFNRQIAFISSLLLFITPAWWYYGSRPFQHNTFFVFLAAAACYFYFLSREGRSWRVVSGAVLSALAAGLALYVRPAEIIWFGALSCWGVWRAKKIWGKRGIAAVLAVLFLVAVLFFSTQFLFYGKFLGSGYVRPEPSGEAGSIFSGPQGINFWQAIFLPFGFHPRAISHNAFLYFINFFRPWTVLFLAGLVLTCVLHKKKIAEASRFVAYAKIFLPAGIYLLILYGSWNFYDNLLLQPSIGTSYVRYFLPIYVFALPFAAFLILYLWQARWRLAKGLVIFLVAGLAVSSYSEVFLKLEGLKRIKETVKIYQSWQEKIYQLTEPDAVIVTRYADKYIFPGRRVIPGFREDEQIKAAGGLFQEKVPLYFYDLKLNQEEEKELNQRLSQEGLKLDSAVGQWENLELIKVAPK